MPRSRNLLRTACAAFALALAGAGAPLADDDASPAAGAGSERVTRLGTEEPWQIERYRDARRAFKETLELIQAGAAVTEKDFAPELRTYPLYPYLEAARIEKALAASKGAPGAADEAARRFIAAHAGEPVGRDVRRAAVASLARREQWRAFLDVLDPAAAGRELDCHRLRARIELGDTDGLAPQIVDVWLSGNQLPLECEPVFEWLRGQGLLGDDLVERRVVLLLENGQAAFARVIARRLPADRAAPLLRWAELLEHPLRAIDAAIAAPDTVLPAGALLAGFSRLARSAPSAALERYAALTAAHGMGRRAASPYALALALGLAWDRRSEALDYFAAVAPQDMNDYALTWQTRAALWAGDFALADESIAAMSDAQRDETRWRYWAARAAEAEGQRANAQALYRSILPTDNYYAAMAAARLERPAEPHPRTLAADRQRVLDIATQPAFVRARELVYADLPWLARAEWNHGREALDDADRLLTIHVAALWQWYDVVVATATRHRIFNDYELLYPRPYEEAVDAAAELTRLEPPLIYGVIRQESLFRRRAASAAGALGLAQLLPDTARRAARRWGLPDPSYADLFVPETNVALGAAELRSLIDEFDGQIEVGLAGYNAGPNAARRWLPERPLDADVWIENIPYNETRDYVQRVLWHSLVFAWLESGEPRSTEAWLAKVAPLGSGERELHAER
ncbi:MAG: lytic transglycosylase domain-containing protein [Gammaproteobacteria bacterium]|nr:lytic transglycosylase domain-containing protein [Gammaproteobacteria bacterium]